MQAWGLREFVHGGTDGRVRRSQHVPRTPLWVQVAFALVLPSARIVIRTFHNMRNVPPGFTDPATVQSVRVLVPALDVPEPERVTRVQQNILARLAAIPGVTSAAFVDALPTEEPLTLNAIVAAEDKKYGQKGIPPTRTIRICRLSAQTLEPAARGRDLLGGAPQPAERGHGVGEFRARRMEHRRRRHWKARAGRHQPDMAGSDRSSRGRIR
jgi:hypothetical protein